MQRVQVSLCRTRVVSHLFTFALRTHPLSPAPASYPSLGCLNHRVADDNVTVIFVFFLFSNNLSLSSSEELTKNVPYHRPDAHLRRSFRHTPNTKTNASAFRRAEGRCRFQSNPTPTQTAVPPLPRVRHLTS